MGRVAWIAVALWSMTGLAESRCLSVEEAVAAAGAPIDPRAYLTPPIPVSWPPSGAPAVRYFDFRAAARPTGVVSYSLESPSTEITVPLDGGHVQRRVLSTRSKLGTFSPPVDPKRLPHEASALLIKSLCEQRIPTEVEGGQIRAGYSAWLRDEPLVRDWLVAEAGPFVEWLFPTEVTAMRCAPFDPAFSLTSAPKRVLAAGRLGGSRFVVEERTPYSEWLLELDVFGHVLRSVTKGSQFGYGDHRMGATFRLPGGQVLTRLSETLSRGGKVNGAVPLPDLEPELRAESLRWPVVVSTELAVTFAARGSGEQWFVVGWEETRDKAEPFRFRVFHGRASRLIERRVENTGGGLDGETFSFLIDVDGRLLWLHFRVRRSASVSLGREPLEVLDLVSGPLPRSLSFACFVDSEKWF